MPFRLKINKGLDILVAQLKGRLLGRVFHLTSDSNSRSKAVHYNWMSFWKIQALYIQFMGKQGTKSRDLGATFSFTAEKFKVTICAFMGKKANHTVSVMSLLALGSKLTLQSLLCDNGQDSSCTASTMLSFLSAEGGGGTSQGEEGLSFRSPCAAFCFFLLLMHSPSVMHVCGKPSGSQTMWSLSDLTALPLVTTIWRPSRPLPHSCTPLAL